MSVQLTNTETSTIDLLQCKQISGTHFCSKEENILVEDFHR